MSSLSLVVADQSESGSYHVKILVDDKDSGILYVSPEQFDFIVKSFWRSCTQENISFNVDNPFDSTATDGIEDDEEE